MSGENLALLKEFLNLLTTRMPCHDDEPAEFQIDDTYSVPGVGTVVSGTTLRGVIKLNDTLLLGPDPLGHFQQIAVKSIHRKRMAVTEVKGGQTASFALKKVIIKEYTGAKRMSRRFSISLISFFRITDKTLTNPQGNGHGIAGRKPASVLGIRGGNTRTTPSDNNKFTLPSDG